MKSLLEGFIKTKIYYKEVCLSKIIYFVQGHTENLFQCLDGKIALMLQM